MAAFEIKTSNEKKSLASLLQRKPQVVPVVPSEPVHYERAQYTHQVHEEPSHKGIDGNPPGERKYTAIPENSAWNVGLNINEASDERGQTDRKLGRYQVFNVDKDSLEYHISDIRKKINELSKRDVNNFTHDTKSVKKFQEKFIDASKSWNIMMDSLVSSFKKIDELYKNQIYKGKYYLGLRDRLMQTITNIAVSFIMIGEKTTQGPGISNMSNYLRGTRVNLSLNKPIGVRINNFLKVLPESLETISPYCTEIEKLVKNRVVLLDEKSSLESQIENLKKIIKTQVSNLGKLANTDKDTAKAMQDNLAENQKSLLQKIAECEMKATKETEVVKLISKHEETISAAILQTFDVIDFSYFMHNDYFTQLDYCIGINPF